MDAGLRARRRLHSIWVLSLPLRPFSPADRFDTCEVFDATAVNELFVFQLGRKDVVQGWEIGLREACVGQMRKISVPSSLGFGDEALELEGRPIIPPNTSLHYEIRVVKIERSELPQALEVVDEEVQAKLQAADRAREYKHKVNSPRTSKHTELNLKRGNHELSKKGLADHREKVADRKLRQEVLRRRMSSGEVGDL